MQTITRSVTRAFTPNEDATFRVTIIIVAAWACVAVAWWQMAKPAIFPSPLDVLSAFPQLWADGLGQELLTSMWVNWEALFLSALISLPLAYVSRTPALRPFSEGVAKLRFVSPAVFYMALLFVAHSGHEVKVYMLTMGETFFLATTMIGVVQKLPNERFDDCRTLRMSEWKATWYVAIRGTMGEAIDAIRDNAAMGYSMLMMVEGVVRSEGGVGVLILNQEKHMNFDAMYAVAIAILLVGLGQDYLIGMIKRVACPYGN